MNRGTSNPVLPNLNQRAFGMALPVHQLMPLLNPHHLLNLREVIQCLKGVMAPLVSNGTNHHMFHTADNVRFVTKCFDFVDYFLLLGGTASGFQYDYHFTLFISLF